MTDGKHEVVPEGYKQNNAQVDELLARYPRCRLVTSEKTEARMTDRILVPEHWEGMIVNDCYYDSMSLFPVFSEQHGVV